MYIAALEGVLQSLKNTTNDAIVMSLGVMWTDMDPANMKQKTNVTKQSVEWTKRLGCA